MDEDGTELSSLNIGETDRFRPVGFESESKEALPDEDEDTDDENLDLEASLYHGHFAQGSATRQAPCPCCDAVFCFCFNRVGNFRILFETGSGIRRKLWCLVGPFWPCTLCVTYPFLLALTFGLGVTFRLKYPLPLLIIWYGLCGFCLVSLALTSFSNPGIVSMEKKRPHRDWMWTRQTNSFRPKKAVFCRDCNCIVEEYDHVCPWTGTAIGKRNMCFFQSFVSSCAIMFLFALFMVIAGSAFAVSK